VANRGNDIDLDPRTSEARQALEQHDPGRAARLATSVVQVADAPFLPGSEGAWVEMIRLRLQRRRTTALGLLAEAALLAGDQALAVANAETAVAADPLDETFHRLLMHAHAASGNRAQALLAYARCRELLADELGTDPSPKTEGIYLDILRMGPARKHTGANADLFGAPPTHFVRFGSQRIPYQVLGEGTSDLLITGGSFSNVDSVWHHPTSANVFRCLTGAGRVIQFDRWGGGSAGLPQAGPAGGAQELRAWGEVFQVVLDAAESRETALLATLDGGPPAIHFAVHASKRVRRLVLINTTARWLTAPDYSAGLPVEQARQAIQWIEDQWGTEAFAAEMYPSEVDDQEFLRWYAANQRALARPEIAAARMRGLGAIDVRSLLHRIRVPTLVIHRKDHLAFPLAQGQYLAQHIPNACFLELPGRGGLFGADSQDLAQSVLAFLCE